MLERISTNSQGRRTGGETMGFSGKEIFPVLASLLPTMILFVVFGRNATSPFILMGCFVPTLLTAGFVLVFIHGRPPSYLNDLVEGFYRGRNFIAPPTVRNRSDKNPY